MQTINIPATIEIFPLKMIDGVHIFLRLEINRGMELVDITEEINQIVLEKYNEKLQSD